MSTLDLDGANARKITPEQRLFLGVVTNAAMEATGKVKYNRAGELAEARDSALAWFVNADDDFKMICEYAGLESDIVRERVLGYVERVKHSRSNAVSMRGYGSSAAKRINGTPAVTVSDVAEHAGVASGTVHRAMNGSGYVSAKTKARVHASIKALGYTPTVRRSDSVH